MSGIAASLEQEFAERSQSEREEEIVALKKIVAEGRGEVPVTETATMIAVAWILGGAGVIYAAFAIDTLSWLESAGCFLLGVLLFALAGWLFLRSKQPAFTLTEEGLEIRGQLLPWAAVSDYEIHVNGYSFFTIVTSIALHHVEGYQPPALDIARRTMQIKQDRKTDLWKSHLGLFVKAKGMNGDDLAEQIGRFLAAAHAREALRQLGA